MLRGLVSTIVGIALTLGLLHGASMMIGTAAAQGVDCHTVAATDAADHQQPMTGHRPGSAAPSTGDRSSASDHGPASQVSSCPLANIAAIDAVAPDAVPAQRGTTIVMHQPAALVSAVLDRADPPPRLAA